MYRMSDDTCGHVPGSLARCQTYIGRTYGIRYRIDDEKRYCCELLNKAFRNATGEQLLGDLTRDDLSGRGHSRTRTIASAVAGQRAIWFIVSEWVTGPPRIRLKASVKSFGFFRSRFSRAA